MDGRSLLLLLLLSLVLQQLGLSHASSASTVRCHAAERDALMALKQRLRDPSGRLSSWVGQDCCAWEGVGCSNTTGLVTQLDLSAAGFEGKVPDQLGNLSHLHRLDLSSNVYDTVDGSTPSLYIENAGWISRLTSLRHLNMEWVNLRNASNWLQAMNALPHIQELRLANCEIVSFPHNSLLHVNFTSLTTLDLSYNDINSSVPNWLFNLTSLEQLDLGGNGLKWLDLASISKLTSLMMLDLSYNVLQHGFVPTAFCSLCNLQTLILHDVDINDEIFNVQVVFSGCLTLSLEALDLHSTRLKGPVPASLGSLSSLQYLDISYNDLSLSEVHLADLSATLTFLDISFNTLVLNESHEDWIPPFQLESFRMHSCKILPRPRFPKWLQTQNVLLSLDLSSTGIKDTFPTWLPTTIRTLYLSNNEITGQLPSAINNIMPVMVVLDLSMNNLIGSIPFSICQIEGLFSLMLSQNNFSGTLPNCWENFREIILLDLSRNKFQGRIPNSLCNMGSLQMLLLSHNNFSGKLPNCWENSTEINFLDLSSNIFQGGVPNSLCSMQRLQLLYLNQNNFSRKLPNCWKNSTEIVILDLSNNTFQGGIPNSLCSMQRLQWLHLSHNNLSGQIPTCLKGCTKLITLDLGNNHLEGNIPTWIEENLLHLHVLNLRSNDFTGNISPRLSILEYLRVLDLSNNKLSGVLPPSFGNFTALKGYSLYDDHSNFNIYIDEMWLFAKGSELEYENLSSYIRILDLSNNGLYGYIPTEMGNLNLLQSLNLSYNYLTGEIPKNIDRMQQLEVLDLSRNNLSGAIPSSIASLNFLSTLNLSYNNLSGRIPIGTQLQTFDQSSYLSNPNLCGFPLPNNCHENTTKYDEEQKEDTNYKTEIIWLFASVALGFITGFWTICGVLISQRRWRFAFFRAVDDMHDKVYVMIVVNIAKLRRE